MNIQECRQFLQDREYLTQYVVPLYQKEEDKLKFARQQLLHLIFETGINKGYQVEYLDTLCSLIDSVCQSIFSYTSDPNPVVTKENIAKLLHYALLNDLEDLLTNMRFNEAVFSELEEYKLCANLTYLQAEIISEINRKSNS